MIGLFEHDGKTLEAQEEKSSNEKLGCEDISASG